MKRVVLALAALGILSVSSVMAAPVSYQSVLTGKVDRKSTRLNSSH